MLTNQQRLRLSKYQISVICIYAVITLALYVTLPRLFVFSFSTDHLASFGVVLTILSLSALGLYGAGLRPSFKAASLLTTLMIVILGGILIVLPEEIIFRALIQGSLQSVFENGWIAIIAASLIYGAAHLANAAHRTSSRRLNWKLAFWVSVAGLPLGYLFYATHSLLLPILLHTLLFTCANLKVQSLDSRLENAPLPIR